MSKDDENTEYDSDDAEIEYVKRYYEKVAKEEAEEQKKKK